jgi:anti-sigma factor RsiW
MNPGPERHDWRETILSGRADPETLQRLRSDLRGTPSEAAELEDELALNRLLNDLPAPPVPSNLASRVIQQVELESRRPAQRSGWLQALRLPLRWTAPVALAAALTLTLAFTGWWQVRSRDRRNLAESLAMLSRVTAVPGVEVFEDFDAIRLLPTSTQPGDVELIAALNTP